MEKLTLSIAAIGIGFFLGKYYTNTNNQESSSQKTAKQIIRKAYAERATETTSCCGGGDHNSSVSTTALSLGYSKSDVDEFSGKDGTNLGESCGNPISFANIQPGETIVDLGSGAGFDVLIASKIVETNGKVIGIDMTPEMIDRARRNASRRQLFNVEFRLGEIEHLPIANDTINCLISNCVINLAQDKRQVYKEALRVLKPGGRIAISDVLATDELPDRLKNEKALAC